MTYLERWEKQRKNLEADRSRTCGGPTSGPVCGPHV